MLCFVSLFAHQLFFYQFPWRCVCACEWSSEGWEWKSKDVSLPLVFFLCVCVILKTVRAIRCPEIDVQQHQWFLLLLIPLLVLVFSCVWYSCITVYSPVKWSQSNKLQFIQLNSAAGTHSKSLKCKVHTIHIVLLCKSILKQRFVGFVVFVADQTFDD